MKHFLYIVFILAAATSCSMEGYNYLPVYRDYDSYTDAARETPGIYDGDKFDKITENEFVKVADQPVSTFSIDADGAAYAYMRRCIGNGILPSPNSVRTEEFLNYFTFDYPEPATGENLGINYEIGVCPWNTEHFLLRLGIKGRSIPESEIPTANFILLVDTSGSMSGDDRIELLKSGLCNMIDHMRPTDRIAVITYSGEVKMLLESTLVKDAAAIKQAISKLEASGSTAGGEAMKMAYEEAVEHYIKGGNNRIIMCTDGDFNVGVSSTEALVEMVESYLNKGIYLSIMGFGTGNLQDSKMENLSNHGNGTYNYIDCEDEMMKVFVHERSRFYSVANDVKCQVKFFDWVDSYRLIGYENRVMNNEDFENDKKDAGEIGAGQTITALYELVPSGSLTDNATAASFDVRYKMNLGEESRSLHLDVGKYYQGVTKTGAEFDFAAGIAAYAMILRNSKFKGTASYSMVTDLIGSGSNPAAGVDPLKLRKRCLELVETASAIKNN